MRLTNDKTINNFLIKLQNEGKSAISIKNYKSDLVHFLAWAVLKLKSFGSYAESVKEIIPFLNQDFFQSYKNYMAENKIKFKTINRRLSTLRNFSGFLFNNHMIDSDFMHGIQNIGIGIPTPAQIKTEDIIDKFRETLEKDEKVSANTIKNYVSDVRNFLIWIERQNQHAAQSR